MLNNTLRRITIFDTTLRDGDQSAGFAFSAKAKLHLARLLVSAGVDVVEAGFPLSSQAEFDMCRAAALELKDFTVKLSGGEDHKAIIAVLSRGLAREIVQTAKVFEGGIRGTIHISLPVSKRHISVKLKKTESEVLAMAVESVSLAAGLASGVELGAEDATRADRSFLLEYCAAAVEAGAAVVNISDTAGAACPDSLAELIGFIIKNVPAFASGKAALSAHCHNDLGLACANTLAAIKAGCNQAEVSILGIGERAGNAALEEVFASLVEHQDIYNVRTALQVKEIGALISSASLFSGTAFSLMKPLSGWNTRAHASGIHQQSLAKDPRTYCLSVIEELDMVPERIVLSRHSGKAGVRLFAGRYLGLELEDENAQSISARIKGTLSTVTGITEFICILSDMNLTASVSASPLMVSAFSETVSEQAGEYMFRIDAEVKPYGTISGPLTVSGEAQRLHDAVIKAVNALPGAALKIKNTLLDGCGGSLRLYAEVLSESGRIYPVERSGVSSARLLFECCLDALNAERQRKS
ncbi:MAG: 2-isopropylmalate synthase [Spirochaetia bacterium]|jgi:2-isopropylmalate synthase|nr:2-isopropylmalate synthase [Spirochaetia bacterium]